MRMKWKSWLKGIWTILSISLAFWYFIEKSPQNFFEETRKIDLRFLGLGVLCYLGFILISTYRWIVLMKQPSQKLPLGHMFIITLIAKGFGSITPMNAGEFLKAELSFKLSESTRTKQYAIVAIERGLDILTLLTFAGVGIIAQSAIRYWLREQIVLIFISTIVCCVIVTFLAILLYRKLEKVRRIFQEFYHLFFTVIEKKQILILTMINWMIICGLWWALFAGFHLNVTFTNVLLLLSITTFVIVGSFIPGGIGLADITASEVALRLGYQPNEAMFFPIAIRTNTLISLLFGAIAWIYLNWKQPQKTKLG